MSLCFMVLETNLTFINIAKQRASKLSLSDILNFSKDLFSLTIRIKKASKVFNL